MSKTELTEIQLTANQRKLVESLDPADGREFAVVGQVFVGDDPRAGTMYCYQFNRAQYDIVAKAILQAFEIVK